MARKFKDANLLLHDLLDRFEAGTAAVRAYPHHEAFRDITEADRFERELRRPELADAIQLIPGTGRHRDRTIRVDLADAGPLYTYLGRQPAISKASNAAEAALAGADWNPVFSDAVNEARAAWSRNKRWCGLRPGDSSGLRDALLLAQAIMRGQHASLDFRTFSRRVTGDSKRLEHLEPALMRLLANMGRKQTDQDARSFLSELGLEKFGPPLLLAGPVTLDGLIVPPSLPYVGIPANAAGRISFHRPPQYILSIENQTSFNRQVIETDQARLGLVIYSGGYPSLDIQRAIGHLARLAPDASMFHWSDIDPEGLWIFRIVERAAGRAVMPHLMAADLAEEKGTPLLDAVRLRATDFESSQIYELACYLERPGAKWLEQEELDPRMPLLAGAPSTQHETE